MAEIPHFLQESPGWRAGGVEPSDDFKASGYVAGYKPPAGFFNWFWTRVSVCISELQNKLRPYMQENEYEKAQLSKQLYVRTVGMESTVSGTVQDITLPDGMDIADIRGIPIRVGGAGDGKSTAPATSNVSLRVNGEFSAPLLLPAPGYRSGIPPSEGMPGMYIFTEGYTRELPAGWSDFGYTATLTQVPEWEEGLTQPTQYFDAFVLTSDFFKRSDGPCKMETLWIGTDVAGDTLKIANMADYDMFVARTSHEASALMGAKIGYYCRAFNMHGAASGTSKTELSVSLSNISATGCTVEYVTRYVTQVPAGTISADTTGAVTQIYGVKNYG